MDRRTENRLIGALIAVVVAGLIVMIVGVTMALTSGGNDIQPSSVGTISTAAPTRPTKDLAAVRQAQQPTLSATPVPSPIGVQCTKDDLTAVDKGSNGATAMMLEYVEIVNSGLHACELPVLSRIEAFTASDTLVSQDAATVGHCSTGLPFCVSAVPLPLEPIPVLGPNRSFVSGGAGIILEHPSRCESEPTPVCMGAGPVVKIVFYFVDGLSVSAEMDPPRQLHGGGLVIWSLRLIGNS